MADTRVPEQGFGDEYEEVIEEVVDDRKRTIALAVALVILLLLLAVLLPFLYRALTPPGAPTGDRLSEGLGWVRSIYGWGQTTDELLRGPSDVAVAPDGTYWTVSGNTLIVGFDANGNPVGMHAPPWGDGPGEVMMMSGLVVDEDGVFYVVDYGSAKILRFDPGWEFVGEVYVDYPASVAVHDGMLAVTSRAGVGILDAATGDVISQWGSRGKDVDQFDGARGIAFGADGTVFVADAHNKRVKAYTTDGDLVWSFPDESVFEEAGEAVLGEATPQEMGEVRDRLPLQLPTGVTVDAAGRVLVTDAFNFEIVALDPADGTEIGRWGRDGSRDGEFGYPSDIAYDARTDYFVVADMANQRLQVLTIEGSGGTPLAVLARLAYTPLWICCLPLLFLVIVAVMMALRARRRRTEGMDEEPVAT